MWLSKSELIRKMQMIGYYYDEINSYDECFSSLLRWNSIA